MYVAHVANNFVYIKLLNDYNETIMENNPKYNQFDACNIIFSTLPIWWFIFVRHIH